MIAGSTATIESPIRLDGWLVGFSDGKGTWFYTPDKPPEPSEKELIKEQIERTSGNFPTKEEAEAFGLGFEKDVERKL